MRSPDGVHRLRQRPAVDVELDWFFNRAECDMGNRSNFDRALGPLCPRRDDPTPEEAAEAAHGYRQIRGWLLAISDANAGVLQAAYEVRPWPARLHDEFGRLTGIVVRLACAYDPWPYDRRSQELLEMVRAGWLAGECAKGLPWAFCPVAKLRRAAEVRFTRAHHAYSGARGVGPCVVRAS